MDTELAGEKLRPTGCTKRSLKIRTFNDLFWKKILNHLAKILEFNSIYKVKE